MEQYTIYEQENVVPKGSTREKKLENDKLCGFNAAFAIILLLVFFFLSFILWLVSNSTAVKMLEDRLKAFCARQKRGDTCHTLAQ